MYSGDIGTSCIYDEHCEEGLICDASVCSPGIRYDSSSKVYCTDSSECQEHEYCDCNGYGAKQCHVGAFYFGNPDGIKRANKRYLKCTEQCLRTDYECITSNCKKEYCTYLEKTLSQVGQTGHSRCLDQYYLQTYYGDYAGYPGYFQCEFTLTTDPY